MLIGDGYPAKICVEEFLYSVNNPRGCRQEEDLHSHIVSFLGFLNFSLVLTWIILIMSSLPLISLLLNVSLHHNNVWVLLCAKKNPNQTPFILSATCPNRSSNSLRSFPSVFEGFLVGGFVFCFGLFFFLQREQKCFSGLGKPQVWTWAWLLYCLLFCNVQNLQRAAVHR